MQSSQGYRVAITPDALNRDGSSVHGDLELERLEAQGITCALLPSASNPLAAEELGDVDAVLAMAHTRFTAELIERAPRLRHIARFGAGYDTIDVDACTRAGVVVTNTPDAVRRPVALAALTLIFALAHRLLEKDRLVRTERWGSAGQYRAAGVTGATVGIVGFGNIGSELAMLLQPFGVRILGSNRRGWHPRADDLDVEMTDLEALLTESDFVVLCASLTPATEHLIGVNEFDLMRESAYVVNVGRGRLIESEALRHALMVGAIAGAGLDVYDPEPPEPDDPVLGLANVILTPHSLSWTKEFARLASASVADAIAAVASGKRPQHVVNPEVFEVERGRILV